MPAPDRSSLQNRLLRALAPEDFSLLQPHLVPVPLPKGAVVIRADEPFDHAYFPESGLASVIFALLALDDLDGAAHEAIDVIALTVLLSVLAHGLTATPLARRYGRTQRAARPG